MQRDEDNCCLATIDLFYEQKLAPSSSQGFQQLQDFNEPPSQSFKISPQAFHSQPRMMLHEPAKFSLAASRRPLPLQTFVKKPKLSSCIYEQTQAPVRNNSWPPQTETNQLQSSFPMQSAPVRIKSEYYNPRFYQPRKSIFFENFCYFKGYSIYIYFNYFASLLRPVNIWNSLESF